MIRGKSNRKLKKRISAIIMSLLMIFSVIPQTQVVYGVENGAYSESNAVSATTLKNYKPKAPVNLSVKENENNSLSVSWSASESATGYKVYRAESRFSEYKLIGSVDNGTEYRERYS